MKHKTLFGFSLIEVLVVMIIFSVIAIVTTQTLLVSLTSTRKSQATTRVRENLEYAVAVMERYLRNADDIISCSSSPSAISYLNEDRQQASFTCSNNAIFSQIGSGSVARLSSQSVRITSCSFSCPEIAGVPRYVEIEIASEGENLSPAESSPVTISTRIQLRVY